MLTIKIIKDSTIELLSVDISDADEAALNYVVMNAAEWIVPEITNNSKGNNGFRGGPLLQKIVKCRKQMIEDNKHLLTGDEADNDAKILSIKNNPAYKNRQQREDEANAG